MNILVATDGTLDPASVADAVGRFYDDGDSVVVMTAMNVPLEFLRGLGDEGVKEAANIALEAGQTLGAGDRAAEQLAPRLPARERPPTDSLVSTALSTTASTRTKPIVEALLELGIAAKDTWRTTENRTARQIIATMKELETDLLVIGSHGYGRFEGLLGSTGTKLVRHAPAAVLILRNPGDGA